ncbi:MAG: hypothetical protein ACKV2O_03370 [Acidimicrobiales bacterium]
MPLRQRRALRIFPPVRIIQTRVTAGLAPPTGRYVAAARSFDRQQNRATAPKKRYTPMIALSPTRKMKKLSAVALLIGTLSLGATACGNDEDGNGSDVNEEVESVESVVEDIGNEVQQQVDEGAEEDTETTN